MPDAPLRILVIGAHPDDCDISAGGTAALYRAAGHHVRFVSVTNGDAGHHRIAGLELSAVRKGKAAAAGSLLGIEYDVLDYHDGHLEPNLAPRFEIIGLIRSERPDLVLTHRPNDYHPDHRYTSQLVCDAAYMVTVPAIVPQVPALRHNPAIAYLADGFARPYPFSPTVAVDIEPVFDRVVDMLDCHVSQFYEWLPYNGQYEQDVPGDPAERRRWLADWYRDWISPLADRHRDLLVDIYGEERGRRIRYIEAFEPCEYGAALTSENIPRLFPFLPR